jgi:hypothetical protein
MSNSEVAEKVYSGYRMQVPKDCPSEVYDMMKQCWAESPSDRPSFKALHQQLEDLFEGRHRESLLTPSAYNTKISESVYETPQTLGAVYANARDNDS